MRITKKPVESDLRKSTLKKGLFALSLFLIALVILPVLFLMKGQERHKGSRQIPIIDYVNEIGRNEVSFAGCSQKGRGEIKELPSNIEELPVNSHWWVGLSPLPVEESEAVIVGEVTDSKAHLTKDKTNIFSEFTLKVETTFKHNLKNFTKGDSITVVRCGGGVRFPSGKIQYYLIDHQGLPSVGSRYLLFLKLSNEIPTILTGYEITEGRINPLDKAESNEQKIQLPFSKYQDVEFGALINDLVKKTNSSIKKY